MSKHFLTKRLVAPEDTALLFKIFVETREDGLSAIPIEPSQKKKLLRMQFDAMRSQYNAAFPNGEFQLIFRGAEPIGTLAVDRQEKEIHIIDMALLPRHQGAGIGTQLLDEILQEAELAEINVSIHVTGTNRAVRLYHRLGFRTIEDLGAHLLMVRDPRNRSDPK